MRIKQRFVAQCLCILHPSSRCFRRIHTHIRFRVAVVRIEVDEIIRIGCNQEYHFIRTADAQLAVLVAQRTALVSSLNTDYEFHLVVVQTRLVHQSVASVGFHLTGRYRVRFVAEYQVLLARLVGLEADSHHIVRVGDEVVAFILHTVFLELNHSQCRVQRKRTLVFTHANGAQACFHVKLAHGGEVTETERLFFPRFVRHGTVEVLAGKHGCLLLVAVYKRLADFIQEVCRLLVHVPIGFRSCRSVRTTTPQCLFVEGDAFRFYRTHDVRTQATVADRERLRFPSGIRILGRVSSRFRLGLAFPHIRCVTPPYRPVYQRSRLVEPDGKAPRVISGIGRKHCTCHDC